MFDQTLTCSNCGSNFVFTAGEQELLAVRGASGAPSDCPPCRRPHMRAVNRFEKNNSRA